MRTDDSTVPARVNRGISLLELFRYGNLAVAVEDNVKLRIGSPYRKYIKSNKIHKVCLTTRTGYNSGSPSGYKH